MASKSTTSQQQQRRRKSCLKRSTSSSTSSNEDKEQREVCWGDLKIYEFPNILGDHPSVSDGPPLTIAWKPSRTELVSIDYHEYLRQRGTGDGAVNARRSRRELIVDGSVRGKLLLSLGYSLQDIVAAIGETDQIKSSRRSNMKGRFDSFKAVFHAINKGAHHHLMGKQKNVASKAA